MATSQSNLKTLLIGDPGVGKTCILDSFSTGVVSPNQLSTIGVDFKSKCLNIDGEKVKMQIWDTAGQDRFRAITSSYYRRADAVLIVYAIDNRQSFDSLYKWIAEKNKNCDSVHVLTILVSNKNDLQDSRVVSNEEGEEFARKNGMPYMAVSAYEGNVDQLFILAARNALKMKQQSGNQAPVGQRLEKMPNKGKCSCF